MWYTSESGIFVFNYDNHWVSRAKSSHTLGVDRLVANKLAVFASGFDKVVSKFEIGGNHEEVAKITLPNKAMVLAADDDQLYVLNHSSEVSILDARDLSTKLSKKLSFDATSLTICG